MSFVAARHPRLSSPAIALFSGVDYVFHFAGIGDIVPSIERPIEYMSINVQGTVQVLECARHAGVEEIRLCRVVVLLRPGRHADARRPSDRAAISLRAEQVSGRAGGVPLAQVYRLPVNSIRIFNAYGTRSRTSGAYGAVFGVFLKQKLAGKPFTVVGDGTQTPRFPLRHRCRRRLPARRRDRHDRRDLESRRRQSAIGQSSRRAARRPGHPYSQAAGRAGLHLGRYRQDPARSRLEARRSVSRKVLAGSWRDRLLARRAARGIRNRSRRRPKTGSSALTAGESEHDGRRQPQIRQPQDQDAAEIAAAHRPRPRKQKVIMCHGTFDIVHPGHVRHLLYAKSKGDILVASLTADAHIVKANFRPFVPQDLRAFNLAALEVVDYVVIDPDPTPLENIGIIQPDFFAKGYEYTKDGLHPRTAEEKAVVEAYGGEMHLHAGRHRLFLVAHHRDSTPPAIATEKLMMLAGGREARLRRSAQGDSTARPGLRVHVVGDTIVDSYTHTDDDRRHDQDADDERAVRGKAATTSAAPASSPSICKAAGAEVTFSTVLGDDPLGEFVLKDLESRRHRLSRRSSIRRGRPPTRTRSSPAAIGC